MISNFVKTERGSVLSDGEEYFPASKIAEILKVSRTAVYKKATKERWPEIRIPGKGARNGVAHYLVPRKILINEHAIDSKQYPGSTTTTHLVTGTEKHTGLIAQTNSINGNGVNNYVTLPKYALQTMPDLIIRSEQVVDHLAFKKDWLEMSFNIQSNNRLALIQVKGDSMEPTLKSDDLILTDISESSIGDDSIYVLQLKNDLVLKRIQRKMNGSVVIKSDNPVYGEEELDESAVQSLQVVGRVIWFGRRI